MRDSIVIGIAGAGGDGVVAIGEMLLKIARMNGYYGRLSKYYGPQMRGGESAVKLTVLNNSQNGFIEDDLDVLVCFSKEQLAKFDEELAVNEQTKVFDEEFLKSFAFGQNKNLAALGFLLEILGWGGSEILDALRSSEKLLTDENLEVVETGKTEARENQIRIQLSPPHNTNGRIVMDGNRAVSQGALRAGCRFVTSYPITPAKETSDDLNRKLVEIGGVFVQAESEIAAINMIVDASIVGVKSMTVTSGPGLDLKTEGINLAAACEVSIVVYVVQRVGPSTGIATKMEQADLSTAIFGGHGYAPRVVLAPYNLEGCYRLGIEAFNIAEEFQAPVILLSDQYLGQTLQIDDDFTAKEYLIKNRLLPDPSDKGNYKRYRITPNFISPVALPGMEGFEWRATGLTHDEDGNPTNSSEWHQRMQEKITKKLDPLRERKDLVKIFGPPKSKIGLISWGSSGEASLGFIKKAGLENVVKVCIPELISPMPKRIIGEFLKGLEELIVVEMNYSGQYLGFLRRYFNSSEEVDLPSKTVILKRAGGRPWSQREFEKFISEA